MCGLAPEPMDAVHHPAKDRNGATDSDRVSSCQRSDRSGRWQQWFVMAVALAATTCGFLDGRRDGTAILLVHEGPNAVDIAYMRGAQKLAVECVRKATAKERLTAQKWGDLLSTTLLEIRDAVGDKSRSAGQVSVRVTEPGQSSDIRDAGVPLAPGEGGPEVLTEP